ncbi:MAG: SDR family oxidoreductase, partial [Candidatus Heimdallarchaeota archaeon]|nr:SDR family oxidoreductase [Candidatus Heimdallarchaeota archaeon]MCK5142948.1 SDR family oxidoreductase [Candidatus Heimdallarchaeota archaeon]
LTGRNETGLQQICSKLKSLGCDSHYGVGDVGIEADVERHFQDVKKKLGGIDVLFANAGVGYFGNLEDLTIEQYDSQFNTNVRGVFLWINKVLPLLRKQNSGHVIVTSSNLGMKTGARCSLYAGTKHAVQAMVWCLRDELKGTGVKAATINPGSVDTPWFDGKEVDRTKMLAVEDVAKAVRFIIDQDETSDIDHILLLPGKE